MLKTAPKEFDCLFDDETIARDEYIEIKCTNCGNEEDMPDSGLWRRSLIPQRRRLH